MSRKAPIHTPFRKTPGLPGIVFITVCTKNRAKILAREECHQLIVQSWKQASHWAVGRYVILPDHIHLFCAPTSDHSLPVDRWATFWRSLVSKSWPYPSEQDIWQRGFWDTQLRTGDSYDEKWEYVRQNPVRHKLVSQADDWPYAGELTVLPWY
jgi:putative transposase